MSNHLWKKHEPTIFKLQNTFANKISKLGEKFQEKIHKKMEHWFKKANKWQNQENKQKTAKKKTYLENACGKKGQIKKCSHIDLRGMCT